MKTRDGTYIDEGYREGQFLKYKNNSCPVCGGKIIGDGFNTPVHCENVYVPLDMEPDANPLYCKHEEK